jgi:DNA-binding NtrC family response regulator
MPKRVIILDDDAGDRRLLEEAVAVLGYVVTAAGSSDAFDGELARRSATRLETSFDSLPLAGEAMARAIELGRRAAKSSMPLLIEGEADVGKGVMARIIHAESARAAKPFIAVHRAVVHPNQLERHLFGSGEAGGDGAARGKLHEADGGTLFLDGVGELSLGTQARLLEAIDAEWIHPHGVKHTPGPGVRLIAATEQSLMRLVEEKRFREDLYYRLTVFPIRIPPLRERIEEIAPLVKHFAARFAAEVGKRVDGFDAEALALLACYYWPGNVRQLENAVFRAVVLAEGPVVSASEFPQIAAQVDRSRIVIPPAPTSKPEAPDCNGPIMLGAKLNLPATLRLPAANGRDALGIPALGEEGEIRPLEAVEADLIRLAFGRYRGRMTEIARRLGIGRSTLYRKLREMDLEARA